MDEAFRKLVHVIQEERRAERRDNFRSVLLDLNRCISFWKREFRNLNLPDEYRLSVTVTFPESPAAACLHVQVKVCAPGDSPHNITCDTPPQGPRAPE